MEYQNKAQVSLDVEMAKARISKTEPPRQWIVLATATLGVLFVSLQGCALIVALPDLMQGLDIDFATIIWVLLTYTLAITATVPLLGFIGDAGFMGIRCRMFNIGFFVFTLGSLLCGISQKKHSGYDLLGYRVVQGLGGASLISNCFAIVADKFYPYNQVGLASGIISIAFAAGTILGLVIGAIGTLAGFVFCNDTVFPHVEYAAVRKLAPSFDYMGFFSLMATVVLLFAVVVRALFPNGKLSENGSLIGVGITMGVLFVVFLIQDGLVRGGKRYNPAMAPFVDFNLFKNWVFSNRSSLVVLPVIKDPLMAGILLIPFGLGNMVAGMPSGRMADSLGSGTSAPRGCSSLPRSASSSIRIMFTMLSPMTAIVICFKVIISGMPPEAVQELFIYGGGIDAKYLPSSITARRLSPAMAKLEPDPEVASLADGLEESK
ncbi:hypothetical protein BGX23_005423 [Mortierella sp. AD031]|nr:hypothetical protein BGX23_005423 [Mortierella sp. AD031]